MAARLHPLPFLLAVCLPARPVGPVGLGLVWSGLVWLRQMGHRRAEPARVCAVGGAQCLLLLLLLLLPLFMRRHVFGVAPLLGQQLPQAPQTQPPQAHSAWTSPESQAVGARATSGRFRVRRLGAKKAGGASLRDWILRGGGGHSDAG